MSSAEFDAVAQLYDETFTNSEVGKLQRLRVWNYLDSTLPKSSLNILELNCGTGEDAVWFAHRGHNVLASDISMKMIFITEDKVNRLKLSKQIATKQLDINEIDKIQTDNKFDLIFSNFGGLNCLSKNELESLSAKIKKLLNNNGKFIAVVMTDFCLIESLYFFIKLGFKNIFRRKKTQQVIINDSIVKTYYYHPKYFFTFFKNNFTINKIIAIGIFIPPSYLNSFFKDKHRVLNLLNRVENFFGNNVFSAAISDHFLIEMNIKK